MFRAMEYRVTGISSMSGLVRGRLWRLTAIALSFALLLGACPTADAQLAPEEWEAGSSEVGHLDCAGTTHRDSVSSVAAQAQDLTCLTGSGSLVVRPSPTGPVAPAPDWRPAPRAYRDAHPSRAPPTARAVEQR